ncbi:ABC transporter substrate-binding protein [Streptomyces sp. NPDC017979]|uniref:ABC transporter substrate-binding protein n=1 Tax=Streptomyces sp. NPDC017979 TaxID=3365024 RepID=UPI0037AC9BEB
MPRALRTPALLLTTVALLSGCGATVEKSQEDRDAAARDHYPVTVENCGERRTFAKAPERVVTNDVGITEIMFALGLEERMAGYVMPDNKGSVHQVPWKDGYERTTWLSKKRINTELVLDAKADLVFAGWNYGFDEGEGFTPAKLKKLGVDSYVLSESCRSGRTKARGVMPPLEALYTDLLNLGKVFDVEDRAKELVATFRKEVADVEAAAPRGADRPRVFLYDDGRDRPFTSGAYAGPHDIITRAGGDHVMKDLKDSWTAVGWETVVERDPEVIVINNYGNVSAEEKKRFLLSYAPLARVSAIKNERFVVLDYVDLVESPRNPSAISRLAKELRRATP